MRSFVPGMALAIAALALMACGNHSDSKAPTQVAARIDDTEISVHQINDVLAQAGQLTPEQTRLASRRVLDGLIAQELLVQRAKKAKLDDDPRVVRAVEAARRQILARAYLDQRRALERKPEESEITAFYDANPALFRERRVYAIDEFAIDPAPDLAAALDPFLARRPDQAALAAWLGARQSGFALRQGRRPAEQLPAPLLAKLQTLTPGQSAMFTGERGITVLRLVGATPAPVTLDVARPAIEQLLMRERLARVEQQELRALREGAKVEFFGEFAVADKGGAAGAPPALPGIPGAAALGEPTSAVPGFAPAAPPAPAASGAAPARP